MALDRRIVIDPSARELISPSHLSAIAEGVSETIGDLDVIGPDNSFTLAAEDMGPHRTARGGTLLIGAETTHAKNPVTTINARRFGNHAIGSLAWSGFVNELRTAQKIGTHEPVHLVIDNTSALGLQVIIHTARSALGHRNGERPEFFSIVRQMVEEQVSFYGATDLEEMVCEAYALRKHKVSPLVMQISEVVRLLHANEEIPGRDELRALIGEWKIGREQDQTFGSVVEVSPGVLANSVTTSFASFGKGKARIVRYIRAGEKIFRTDQSGFWTVENGRARRNDRRFDSGLRAHFGTPLIYVSEEAKDQVDPTQITDQPIDELIDLHPHFFNRSFRADWGGMTTTGEYSRALRGKATGRTDLVREFEAAAVSAMSDHFDLRVSSAPTRISQEISHVRATTRTVGGALDDLLNSPFAEYVQFVDRDGAHLIDLCERTVTRPDGTMFEVDSVNGLTTSNDRSIVLDRYGGTRFPGIRSVEVFVRPPIDAPSLEKMVATAGRLTATTKQ